MISSAADQGQAGGETSKPKEFHSLAPPGSNASGGEKDREGDSSVENRDNQSSSEVIGKCLSSTY